MALTRLLLIRSLRRASPPLPISAFTTTTRQSLIPDPLIPQNPSQSLLLPTRSFAFSSAEEAAAERRRRKRRLRIEPPLHALRRDPSAPRPPPDPNAPRLPDSTSALVGHRLNLHNRVQSLIRADDLDNASATARQAVFSRTRPTVFTCNAITAAMYRVGRYDDAVALFHFFFNQSNIVPNIVSYNVLINAHCDSGRVDVGLEVYRHILANAPFSPSPVTYRHLTKGLVDAGRIGEGVGLLREMLSKGHGADSLVYNNLIKGFLDLGDLGKANELFDELKERCMVYDGVVSATFMDWFFTQGREDEAMESYRSLLDRQFRMTPATCNVLLECLLKHGRKKDAWALFDTMLDNHTPPSFQAVNSDTFNVMVDECFKQEKLSEAVETFRKVGTKANSKPFSMDVAGYNNIIVRFAEHGMVKEAEEFFEELVSKSLSPHVIGFRTLIDAYLKEGRVDDVVRMFQRMVDANLRVIPSYANRWFSDLIENDKAEESAQVLTKMSERDPKPDPTTYEIVIKGLCGAGAFDRCKEIVGQMMGYGVGVTPALKEYLLDVFEKQGQKDEIERMLDPRRLGGFGPNWQPSGSSRPSGPSEPSSTPTGGFTGTSNNKFSGFVGPSTFDRTAGMPGSSSTPAGPYGQNGGVGFQRPNMPFDNGRTGGFSSPGGAMGSATPSGHYGQVGGVGLQGPHTLIENNRFGGYSGSDGAMGSSASSGHYGPRGGLGPQGYPDSTNNSPPTGYYNEGGGLRPEGLVGSFDSSRSGGFASRGGTLASSTHTGYYEGGGGGSGPQGPVGSINNSGFGGGFASPGGAVGSSSQSTGYYGQSGGLGQQGMARSDNSGPGSFVNPVQSSGSSWTPAGHNLRAQGQAGRFENAHFGGYGGNPLGSSGHPGSYRPPGHSVPTRPPTDQVSSLTGPRGVTSQTGSFGSAENVQNEGSYQSAGFGQAGETERWSESSGLSEQGGTPCSSSGSGGGMLSRNMHLVF